MGSASRLVGVFLMRKTNIVDFWVWLMYFKCIIVDNSRFIQIELVDLSFEDVTHNNQH